MTRTKSIYLALLAVLLSPMAANADFMPLDLSGIVNSDLTVYTNGGLYPGPGSIAIAGIDFNLTDGGNGNTWVVGGLESAAANYSVGGLNIENATAMYAIINSAFGACGTEVGSIGVSGANFTLAEGSNVRDHFMGGFCNVQTDAIATASFGGGVIFDVYKFDLSGLVGPITEFTFQNFGRGRAGSPLIAGVTFDVTIDVPEPGTLALLGLGLAGMGMARRKKKV